MSFKSDFAKTTTLTTFLQGGTYSAPGLAYLALFTTMPDPEDSTGGVEVSDSGTGYTRQPFSLTISYEGTNPGDGTVAYNGSPLYFGPRAGTDWGTVLGWGIVDSAGGPFVLLYSGNFTTGMSPPDGETLYFYGGAIQIAER